MRQIIVHFHNFKNAGTTVDGILQRSFGETFVKFDRPEGVFAPHEVRSFLLDKPNLKVLASHQLAYPLPQWDEWRMFSIFFLRHPIDRVGSVYAFHKKQDPVAAGTKASAMAKHLDFKAYIEWQMQSRRGVIQDFQVTRMCGNLPADSDDATRLETAKRNLREAAFFGIVERFEESTAWMKQYLGVAFPSINYTYRVMNRSAGREASLEERVHAIREELGPDIYELLLKNNQGDMALYQYALDLFDERIKRLQQPAERV